MTRATNVAVLGDLVRVEGDLTTDEVEHLGHVDHRVVLVQRLEERRGEDRVAVRAATVEDGLEPPRAERGARALGGHPRQVVLRANGDLDAAGELAREAAVGHDQHMFRIHRSNRRGERSIRNPVDRIVRCRVDRQPVAFVRPFVHPAVARVKDEQVVVMCQMLSIIVQRRENVLPSGVDQQPGYESVIGSQHLIDPLRVAHRALQPLQVSITIVADDQRVISSEEAP